MAYNNIYAFHAAQKSTEKTVENMKVSNSKLHDLFHYFHLTICACVHVLFCQGVRCKRVARSISSVGLYVPGGTAVLPSTALMLSVVC